MRRLIFALAMLPGAAMATDAEFSEPDALMMCERMSRDDRKFAESPTAFYTNCMALMRTAHMGAIKIRDSLLSAEAEALKADVEFCFTNYSTQKNAPGNWIDVQRCLTDFEERSAMNYAIGLHFGQENGVENLAMFMFEKPFFHCLDEGMPVGEVRPCFTSALKDACANTDAKPDTCPRKFE